MHVVWRAQEHLFYQRSADLGVTFSPSLQLSSVLGDGSAVAADGDGVYTTYIGFDPVTFFPSVLLHRSTDHGETFSGAITLASGPVSHPPHLAVDDDLVAVAWREDGGAVRVRVSTDRGATFGAPIAISNSAAPGGVRVAVQGNTIGIVWAGQVGTHADVFYVESVDGGQTFSVATNITNTPAVNSGNPDLAFDLTGAPYIVWDEFQFFTHPIQFAKRENGVFTAPMTVSTGFFLPRIRVRPADDTNVSIVWVGASPITDSDIYLSQSMDGGDTFLPANNVSETGTAESPALDIDSAGRFHVVWSFVGDTQSVHYTRVVE